MKNEWKITDLILDGCEHIKIKTLPVCRIYTVDVADTSRQEIYTEICDALALCRICLLTGRGNTILYTTDTADLSLDADAMLMCELYKFCGLRNILIDIIV